MKRSARLTAVLLAGTMAVTGLAGMTFAAEKTQEEEPLYVQAGVWEEDFVRENDILNGLVTDINDATLVAYKTTEATNKGTVVPFEYDTYYYAVDAQNGDALSHETPITKQAFIYLPYGYDETKQYNVLYLYHGGSDDEYMWFKQTDSLNYEDVDNSEVGKGYAVNLLDHMFEDGVAEPCIVVTPALYGIHTLEREEREPEVANTSPYQLQSLRYELWDLVAAVEGTYSTYAEDTTREELIASREHRAMSGLSMGSIHTWQSGIAGCIELFASFVPMSAGPSGSPRGENEAEDASSLIDTLIIPAIDEAAANGYPIKMLLNMDGYKDIAIGPHAAAHQELLKYMENSDNLQVGVNYDFLVSNGRHMFRAWNLYLYDMLQVLFK